MHRDLKFDEQRAMRVSLERELKLHGDEELLVPKEEEPPMMWISTCTGSSSANHHS